MGTGLASPEACRVLQLGVFDPDPARVGAVMAQLSRAPVRSDALSAILKGQSTLLPRGYFEVRLPDETLADGGQVREGAFVTVVQVVPSPAGWRVSRWESSGG